MSIIYYYETNYVEKNKECQMTFFYLGRKYIVGKFDVFLPSSFKNDYLGQNVD